MVMRIAFAGTPEFARVALDAILAAGHDVVLVLTQPDRPAGRGMQLQPGPVRQCARDAGLPVCQPRSLRLDGRYPDDARAAQHALQAAQPDVMVVAAYGLLLPAWALALPAHGCLNIHASLLPRWRGAAPIQRAIEAGDARTGITIMQMDEGLDTGDMIQVAECPIRSDHTAATLHDALAVLGAQAIVAVLDQLARGVVLPRQAQPAQGVTTAHKLQKSEAALDFARPAAELERRVRAFQPFPVASLTLPGLDAPVRVWRAAALAGPAGAPPGTVVQAGPDGLDIATGDGVLRILELQRAGGRRQPVADFLRGWQRPVQQTHGAPRDRRH